MPPENFKHLQSLIDLPDLSQTKYEFIDKIARGGMGSVFLVRDKELKREVALKVTSIPDTSGHLIQRLRNEAEIIAQLEHPAIVPIHDIGTLPDGRIFYTMKYIRGETLTAWLESNPSLSDRLLNFRQACFAVAFAHSNGVIHRDIKPDNIMVGSFGEVLVMDWGIAKLLKAESKSDILEASKDRSDTGRDGRLLTVEGAIIGTKGFMSPEQAAGNLDAIDQRSDIYMLGATLYFALIRKNPPALYDEEKEADFSESPEEEFRKAELPKPLIAICRKAMSINPDDRYQNTMQLADDIAMFLRREPVSAYRESVFERLGRFLSKNKFWVYILVTYIVIRILIFFTLNR